MWCGLMEQHPSANAGLWVDALFNQPWLNASANSQDLDWEKHDWLTIAVRKGHDAWAMALLDAGVNPSLISEDQTWGGGQALREALDQASPVGPVLLERLWRETDMGQMLTILSARIDREMSQTDSLSALLASRYRRHVDLTAVRVMDRPDLAPQVAALYAKLGEEGMPQFAAAARAQDREGQLRARSGHVGRHHRARS